MRRIAVAAIVACILTGTASAHGPSGSYEGSKDHRSRSNRVTCGKGTAVAPAGAKIYYSTSRGVEVCKDRGPAAYGRVIVSRSGQYAAADGDKRNPGPLTGYVRVDKTGPHCSDGRDQDSTHSRTGGNPQSCDAD